MGIDKWQWNHADADLLYPPYSSFFRELFNNQDTLRQLMKPRPKKRKRAGYDPQAQPQPPGQQTMGTSKRSKKKGVKKVKKIKKKM